jgi:hypothetical protein
MSTDDDIRMLEVLRRHGVPFVIVGGHAVNFHGFRRGTEDVDVVWFRTSETEQKLLAALTELKACYIVKEIDPATGLERTIPVSLSYIRAYPMMLLFTSFGFLDLFDHVPGLPNEDVQQLMTSSIESDGYRFVSLDWLRQMKRTAGRGKDKTDLENLPDR